MSNKSPAIAADLYQKQEAIITDLREQIKQRDQRINSLEEENAELYKKQDYYREIQQELLDLKAKFASNPQLAIQILQPYNPMEDQRIWDSRISKKSMNDKQG